MDPLQIILEDKLTLFHSEGKIMPTTWGLLIFTLKSDFLGFELEINFRFWQLWIFSEWSPEFFSDLC